MLWWIGNIVFLAVIIPVVLMLLQQLLRPAIEIKRYADDALEHGVLLIAHLDAVDELAKTQELVRNASSGINRYGHALDAVL